MLAERYERVDPALLFAPVADLLPAVPARIADIGAGTGRDAAWFAQQGHRVLAVEPASGMRPREQHPEPGIEWVADQLPDLAVVRARDERFDLLILIGVWHHLDAAWRIASLTALRAIIGETATLLMRVRHGPTAPGRPGFDLPLADTIAAAAQVGLSPIAVRPVAAIQAANRDAGVRWTWLALAERPVS